MAVKTKAKPKKKAVAKKAVAKKAVAKKAVAKKPAAKRKTAKKKGAALKTKFLSHGTLIAKNLETTRKFYTEFLGLESIRTSPISLMVRLGGVHVYAVVEQKNHSDKMRYLFHNGLDVTT
ncbi:MAG: VOC family protein, partial [Rhodospirillales bacterium]|nr:VOC family protein [Rhodospirillales bacterium]